MRVLLLASIAVLLYDALMATGSRVLGFAYTSAVLGSYLIYALAGLFGARAGGSVWAGVLTAAAAGLTDSTLGWLLSSAIGPGRPPPEVAGNPEVIAAVVVLVPFLAGIIGLLGALAARLFGLGPSLPPDL